MKLDPSDRLRCLLDRLPELGDDGAWLAGCIGEYLTTDDSDLEALLGLRCGPGGDSWRTRARRVVRYADDIIVGFEHETNAHRFRDAMRARLQEFSLSLHPDKTRLFEFGRHAAARRAQRGLGKPETFDFLGFTFVCGKSRRGRFLVERKTRRDRMRAKLREIKEEMRRRRHQPIPEQGKWLRQVVAGFFAYHAVPTNGRALGAFRYHVTNLWRRTLRRRSHKDRTTRQRVTTLADAWLPRPRILHPWPSQRFAVKHPR